MIKRYINTYYYNHVVQNIIKFKLGCPRSTLAENYKYLLYKYKFSHLDFYTDIGNILCNIFVNYVQSDNLFVYKQPLNSPYAILN